MLYSPSANIAFAHFPKNAGTSVFEWMTGLLPDAFHLDPGNPHLPVAAGLAILAAEEPRPRWQTPLPPRAAETVRIFGVVRDPFEAMVSLFEFWNRGCYRPQSFDAATGPVRPPMQMAAHEGSFFKFVDAAVRNNQFPLYEHFFDFEGPAWPRTRLIDFPNLEQGLQLVCDEFGLDPPSSLPRSNTAKSRERSLEDYRREIGPMVIFVRNYFRWYYEFGYRIAVGRETGAPSQAA